MTLDIPALAIPAILFLLHSVAALLAFRAITSARTPQGAVGWAVFLLALPYVGIPAYLVFGDFRYPGMIRERRRTEVQGHSSANHNAGECTLSAHLQPVMQGFETIAAEKTLPGNQCTLLTDNQSVFQQLFAAIDGAQSYILVGTYILRDDRLGQALATRLSARAAEGIEVFLLYDPVGSHGLKAAFIRQLRKAGIEVADFHARHTRRPIPRQLNFRNHRKLAVIDGQTAFTGGYNLGCEYLGEEAPWRDTMIRITGPVVSQMQQYFADDWLWATGDTLPVRTFCGPYPGNLPVLTMATGPADPVEAGSLYFYQAITSAQKRLWIASPYFCPDPGIIQALRLAAMRGVDVRILMADQRDHWLVWLAAFAFMDEMKGSGVRFFRYPKGFMHQKVLLLDNDISAVGSHNLDSRSCRLNFEMSVIVADQSFSGTIAAMLSDDFAISNEWCDDSTPPLWVRALAPVARLFAPVL